MTAAENVEVLASAVLVNPDAFSRRTSAEMHAMAFLARYRVNHTRRRCLTPRERMSEPGTASTVPALVTTCCGGSDMDNRTPAERFWAKVDKNGPVPEYRPDLGPCWLWTASIRGHGYGAFSVMYTGVVAHRWLWEQENGPVPQGWHLDHLCRVRHCVRPSHLEAVTPRVNILRGISPSAKNAVKTHCPKGHPYAGENLEITAQGARVCAICRRARWRAYYRRKRGVA